MNISKPSSRRGDHDSGTWICAAKARTIAANPKLIILDDATQGQGLLVQGDSALFLGTESVEQSITVIDGNVDALMRSADCHVIIKFGRVAQVCPSDILQMQFGISHKYI